MNSLDGQAALVTGAGRGIGRSIALALARAGADVALLSRTEAALGEVAGEIRQMGRRTLVLRADVSRPEEVRSAVDQVLKDFKKIDILVNNAGSQGPIGPLAEVSEQEWVRTIHTNLIGTFLLCQAVLPSMICRKKGKIINLSGGGATRPRAFFSAYGASKAAVIRLTETLAQEVQADNIQVNAIAPGAVYTQMTEEVLEKGKQAGQTAVMEAEQVKKQRSSPERAAALAVFLASPASNGLTGRLISALHDDWENLPGRMNEVMKSNLFTLRRVDRLPRA